MPDLIDGSLHISTFLKMMPLRVATAPAQSAPAVATSAPATAVAALLAFGKAQPLWDGIWDYDAGILGKPYPSQSEADYALLGMLVREAGRLGLSADVAADATMKVFEQSGLYRRAKRSRVLTQDIPSLISIGYAGRRALPVPIGRLSAGGIKFSLTAPAPRDYVVDELIVAGKVALLAGLGGVSKTMWLMTLAVCVALGKDFLGQRTKAGCVLLILGEEDADEIDRRFNAIAVALGLSAQETQTVSDRVRAFPLNGVDARLTKITGGSLEATDFAAEIATAAVDLQNRSQQPLALIGLDHAGLIHGGEFNSREDVVQTMRQVNGIASSLKVATLVLAHAPKTTIAKVESDQGDVAGSAAWTDLARAVFVLRTMSLAEAKDMNIGAARRGSYVSFTVVKNNYGPTGQKMWLSRDAVVDYGVSVLTPTFLTKPAPPPVGPALNARVKAFIAQHPGQYTKTSLRDKQSGKTGPFKAGKAAVAAAIENLLASGDLQHVTPTGQQRAKFGLRPQVTQVLEAV